VDFVLSVENGQLLKARKNNMAYQAINRSKNSLLAVSSFLQGRVNTTFNDLVKAFGEPVFWDDDRQDAEWIVEFRNVEKFNEVVIATVYKHNNRKSFTGKNKEKVENFSIGGFQPLAADLVKRFIEGL